MAQKRSWGGGRAWSAPWWWVVTALVGLGLAAWINSPLVARWFGGERQITTLASAPPFRTGQRLLLLAPHPDDETLCCGGTVQQARAAGAEVFIAWITAGDGFEFDAALTEHVLVPRPPNMRALGQTRAGEAERAAAVLGVPADHTFMLGYPDGGLLRLFTTNYATPLTAPRTQASRVYVKGALTPGHAFTGRNLETDLRRVLDRVRPDVVLAPAPQDFHADHHTLSYIALRLMGERQQEGRLRFWVVHGGVEWPLPKGLHPTLGLTLPPRAARLPWQKVALTPEQERVKLSAVNTYHTQTQVMGRFMRAFVRENELLSPTPLPQHPTPAEETTPPGEVGPGNGGLGALQP